MKILVLCSNSPGEASMRFRVDAFLDPLRKAGHETRVSSFFDDRALRWPHRVARGLSGRLVDLARARMVDRILVHREVLPLALNEFVAALPSSTPLIFDFDDAVFLPRSGGWRERFARPTSTRLLVERAAVVYAGNDLLAEYAKEFNRNVRVVPTVVDTDTFAPAPRTPRSTPVIGWIGSPSTAPYLDHVLPALDAVAKEVPFTLRLVGAGRTFRLSNARVENLPWKRAREIADFQDLDVGIYPLSDDSWSIRKCGFKAIQYMACGIPFVASPIGVVRTIVRNGQDGLWASTREEWVSGLLSLLREDDSRARLVASARDRVVAHYSVRSLAPSWMRGLEAPHNRDAD